MKWIRITFPLLGTDAVLFLGPYSPYWAVMWLDAIRLDQGIGGLTFASWRASIVDGLP